MARFKPIPKRALIHSATLLFTESKDNWESGEITETPLKRVRFEVNSRLAYSVGTTEERCADTLFFDCTHSLPKDVEFILGNEIKRGERVYTIKAIEECYTTEEQGLHHYEVGLV